MSNVCDFEIAVARKARRRGADVVVCGHIHHAEMHATARRVPAAGALRPEPAVR